MWVAQKLYPNERLDARQYLHSTHVIHHEKVNRETSYQITIRFNIDLKPRIGLMSKVCVSQYSSNGICALNVTYPRKYILEVPTNKNIE